MIYGYIRVSTEQQHLEKRNIREKDIGRIISEEMKTDRKGGGPCEKEV